MFAVKKCKYVLMKDAKMLLCNFDLGSSKQESGLL